MTWLTIAISSYLILAFVFLIDKYLLEKGIPNPALYAFYNGFLAIFIFLLAPFVDFSIPSFWNFLLAFSVGAIFIAALFCFYKALYLFEASRVVSVVGALSPIFSFFLVFVFTRGSEMISFSQGLAFIILILGTFLIVYQKTRTKASVESFLSSVLAALFFAIFFILQKNVFETFQSFWNSLIWISTGGFFTAICLFLFSESVKKEILVNRITFRKKTAFIFFLNKALAGSAGLLQRGAIFLTPGFIEVPIIQSLQGVQYAFLFLLTLIFSKRFTGILKEKISKEIIIQKFLAIILIGVGLAMLVIFNT